MIFRRTLTPWKRQEVLNQKSKKSLNLYGRTAGRISNGVPFGIRKHEPTFNTQSITVTHSMKTIYFHPKGINPKFCEAGVIHESDSESIRYLSEPCKVSINDVKIIPNESVTYDEKNGLYLVRESTHS
jgi:hypothetical protein